MGRLHALAGLLLVGCHLADAADAPECAEGTHPDRGGCAPDEVTTLRIQIRGAAGGTSCSGPEGEQRPPELSPTTLRVRSGEEFQFWNEDSVAHEIRGTEGTAWVTVPAGQLSPFTSIAKVGTWDFRVSGCAKGGTVVVE